MSMSSAGSSAFLFALLLPLCVTNANAQERLVRERAVGVSGSYEQMIVPWKCE